MNSTAPHLEFAPPRTGGLLRALGLAIIAHIVLLVALTMGVQWKTDPVQQAFEAELWSSVPTEAAPPPPPPPVPVPEPEPQPEVKPVPPPPPDAALKAQADIALAKEKAKLEKEKELKRQALEKEQKLAKEKLEKEKQDKEKQRLAQLEKDKQDKLKKEQADKDKLKKEQMDKAAQAKQDQANATKVHDEQLKRIEKLAGNGAPNSNSTSAEAKALSNSYKGRIKALVKRFHTYTDAVVGNPITEVEVQTSPDGTIIGRKITKSSGIKAWDDSVLNALDKAERLPLDENGRSPSPITITWSGQDVAR